jgi:hypothetical protein
MNLASFRQKIIEEDGTTKAIKVIRQQTNSA